MKMLYGRVFVLSFAAMIFAAGCGLAYQTAAEHRAAKMEEQLQTGMTPGQVVKQFGEPDIEDKPDDSTEIWSYAKHANSGDVTAEMLYTSAKAGDKGTFEDLKFTNGKLVSWGEAQHTMAEKERGEFTATVGYGRNGSRHNGAAQTGPNASSNSSGQSNSSDTPDWYDNLDPDISKPASSGGRPNPMSVTF